MDEPTNNIPPLSASEPALAGVRVVEFGQLIAAPLAGMILADLGADVIKVESPAGDPGRTLKSSHFTGQSASPTFAAYNRNKRSVVLDLKDPKGVAAAHKLVESADVVIQNFRFGVMERFGLGYEQKRAAKPELVYASLTGFGFTGPDRDRPAVDLIIQAESGIMEITGFPDGPPTKVGFTLVDAASGNVLAQAILAALFRRMRTGLGDHVTISLLDVALHLQSAELSEYLASGTLPPRVGNSAPTTAPADLMRTNDGYIVISAYFRQHWDILCEAVQLPELIHDPRFETMEARIANRGELLDALERALKTNTTEYWARLLQDLGLVIGRARTYADVATSEQVAANGILIDIAAAEGEATRAVRLPYRLASEPSRVPVRAPFLGEHTDEVLAELGADV